LPPSKATFYYVTGGNVDTYWRVEVPAKAVGGNLCLIPADRFIELVQYPHDYDPFPWRIDDEIFVHPKHEGTAVFTRPDVIRAMHALSMREQGIRVVAEVDDNYLSKPEHNIFMRINKYGADNRRRHLESMSVFDGVVFATHWLRDRYHRAFRKEMKRVPELFVARNNVDLEDWPVPVRPRSDGRLRIGYMGSAQHYLDAKLVYPALLWAAQEGHEIVFVGLDPGNTEGVTNSVALQECEAWNRLNYTHVPWVDPAEYHRVALPFDIGLCPLEDNEHTRGKSDVKMLEYTASGAVGVVSKHPVYKKWVDGETALVAKTQGDFVVQLARLVNDENLRASLVANATQYVKEERSMQKIGRDEWLQAIS